MSRRFISHSARFFMKHEALKDMIQGHMAMDIEVAIKTTAGTPVKTGAMKSEVRHFKAGNNKWRVEADKEYAAYQERGARADGTHIVRHYSSTGTSAGWFKRAVNGVVKNQRQYISEARRAVGL